MKIINQRSSQKILFKSLNPGDCFKRVWDTDYYMKLSMEVADNTVKSDPKIIYNAVSLPTGSLIYVMNNCEINPIDVEAIVK